MKFSDEFLAELIERNDIVDVVSSYVTLNKKSGSYMFGLCPFHSEKTASFSVTPSKQIFYCYSCHKGGDVIHFIMEAENLSFPEAVEFLAKRVGMEIPREGMDETSKKRAVLLKLNKDAARFFNAQLNAPQGEGARDYMLSRGISRRVATNFGLGFAPQSWDALRRAMKEKGYSDYDMFEAGLLKKGQKGGFYDVFRNRLMFPIIDVRGDVIGFSGRILDDSGPKYMNSPESLVYNKSRNLFGLNLAKKSKEEYIILAEGNIDVVSLHQAGFDSAVASLGTALTPEQARLISHYKNQVIIAYDSDTAGMSAAKRAIGILEKLDVKVKVLRLEGAKDPDEYIKKKGPDAFRQLLSGSENQVDYRLRNVFEKYDLSIDEQKVEFLKEATDMLSRLPGSAERQVYAMRVASMTGLKDDAIINEVERRRKKLLSWNRKKFEKEQTRPVRQMQPEDRQLHYENPQSAVAEEGIIRLLYLDPALASTPGLPEPEQFSSQVLRRIYALMRERIDRGETLNNAALSAELSSSEMSLLVSILQRPEDLSMGSTALRDYINRIHEQNEFNTQTLDLRDLTEKLRKKKGV